MPFIKSGGRGPHNSREAQPLASVRMSADALAELRECEWGSYEDHEQTPRACLHIVELIDRSPFKSVVHLYSQAEIDEFFEAACTGTFGLYRRKTCLRIFYQLRPLASTELQSRIKGGSIGF